MTRSAESTEDRAARAERLVGYSYRMPDYYEVGREKVREYAIAVQNDHPAHFDEQAAFELGHTALVAPLTFVSVIGIIAQKYLLEQILTGFDLSQILQTDQKLIFHRPMYAGDRLTVDVSLESFRQTAGSDIIVTKNVVLDETGEPVTTTLTTLVGRTGGEPDPERLARIKDVMMREA
ncbi:acyl dehydratase [Rhodococcus sp. ABRD24]|uniref:(3R)-hydroxyacyl-ACP dehydratase subunit HadA n=1 Tax=Rhodococcus sp. ABRD24 TaxID=2507582 RepID=UPI00103A37B1|nr:(3R)-hydroxyacyl-ACP dehydratase subunit HadA [Rhodococcus sp. ABRD24]QBJ98032.1 acyl dehydratase [Rhodococcus sp. ABRD24]